MGFLGKKYDAVFCYETSPVYMIFPGIVYSKLKKVPLTTYVLDLWPENLYSVLNIQNKFFRKIASSTSRWHYKKCDKLIAMSPSLKEKLKEVTGKSDDKIAVIPQYCEEFYEQDIEDEPLKEKYNGFFKIVYAGNISPAQNLQCAVDSAAMLKRDGIKDIKFIIVGDGMSKADIEKYADELLYRCVAMMNDPLRKKEFRRSAEVFRLEEPLNRCSVDQKTSEQIKSNHTRWKKIAQAAGKIR